MTDTPDKIDWLTLLKPYGGAERALGRLAQGLDTTRLHSSWLWREMARASVTIAQASGHKARVDHLRMALIGCPLERDDQQAGLAAARRVFLAAAPLFRKTGLADSMPDLWPRFWQEEAPLRDEDAAHAEHVGHADPISVASERDEGRGGSPASMTNRVRGTGPVGADDAMLEGLVNDLVAFASSGSRPTLITLLTDLRQHAVTSSLPPSLVRIALPLALQQTGLVPKAAPGLLGGRRLPLGMGRTAILDRPLSPWLINALEALTDEADQAYQRLNELTRQHQAWHQALAGLGLRGHSRLPKMLDLLVATPVVTNELVARHLDMTHRAAGMMTARLADLGVLIDQSSRPRHQIFVAGDLALHDRGLSGEEVPLSVSEPLGMVDGEAIETTLDDIFAELNALNMRAKARLNEKGH